MPRFRIISRPRRIPWREVLDTITIFPSQLHENRPHGSVASSPEAAFAKGWETVMSNLAIAWQTSKEEMDAKEEKYAKLVDQQL